MWRSAVQVCLGLPVSVDVNVSVNSGGLAQLARAPALQAGGQRFESVILHVRVRTGYNPEADTESDFPQPAIFDMLAQARL